MIEANGLTPLLRFRPMGCRGDNFNKILFTAVDEGATEGPRGR